MSKKGEGVGPISVTENPDTGASDDSYPSNVWARIKEKKPGTYNKLWDRVPDDPMYMSAYLYHYYGATWNQNSPYTERDLEWLLTTDTGYFGRVNGNDVGTLPNGNMCILDMWACGFKWVDQGDGTWKPENPSGDEQAMENAEYAHTIVNYAMTAEAENGSNVPLYKRPGVGKFAQKLIDWCLRQQNSMANNSNRSLREGPLAKGVYYVPKEYTGLQFNIKLSEMMNSDKFTNAFTHNEEDQIGFQQIKNFTAEQKGLWSYRRFSDAVMGMLRCERPHYQRIVNKGGWSSYKLNSPDPGGGLGYKSSRIASLVWREKGDDIGITKKHKVHGKVIGKTELKQFHVIPTLGNPDGNLSGEGNWFADWFSFAPEPKSGDATDMLTSLHPEKSSYRGFYPISSGTWKTDELSVAYWKSLRYIWRGKTDDMAAEFDGWFSDYSDPDDFSRAKFFSFSWKQLIDEDWSISWDSETEQAFKNYLPKTMEIYFNDEDSPNPYKLGPTANGKATVEKAPGGKKLVINGFTGQFAEDSGQSKWYKPDTDFPKPIWNVFLKSVGAPNYDGPDTRMTEEWALKNLTPDREAPYPGNAAQASSMLGEISQAVKDAFKASDKAIDLSSVRIQKSEDSFTDLRGDHVFGEKMFRRFYIAAYASAMYYYNMYARGSANGNVADELGLDEIMGWTAYWASILMNQLWTQFLRDHSVGNTYALLAAYYLLDEDIINSMPKIDMSIIDDAKKSAENSIGNMAEAEPVPEGLGEKDKAQRERLYKQCALLLNMDRLYSNPYVGSLASCSINKGHPFHKHGLGSYNDRIICVQSSVGRSPTEKPLIQSNNLLNKLIAPKAHDINRFLDLKVPEAANLMPYVRLYKVFDKGEKQVQREFKFQMNPDPNRISRLSSTKFDRGDGVGLKELTWEYDGETPATATKYIKAKMTLLFQNFEDFVRLRETKTKSGKRQEGYRYVDLFVSPTNMDKRQHFYHAPHSLQYDPNYYRIKLEIGYSPSDLGDSDLQRALKHINRSFFLVLIDNEISINEDMTVSVTANYRAYIEEAMDSYKFNALTSPDILRERAAMRQAWEKAVGDDEANCNPKQLADLRVLIDGKMEALTKKAHQSIMMRLLEHDRIHYIDFSKKEIDNFRKNGIFSAVPRWTINGDNQAMPPKSKEKFKEWIKNQKGEKAITFKDPAEPEGNYRSYFFYLGDLLYILVSNLYGYADLKGDPLIDVGAPYLPGATNTKFCLLDFEYHVSLDKASPDKIMNMADIPIDVDFFIQWYTDLVIKGDLITMPIGSFIKRLMIDLITEALAESCVSKSPDHRVSFGVGSFLAGGIALDNIAQPGAKKGEVRYMDPLGYMIFKDQTLRLDAFKNYNKNKDKSAPPEIGLPLINYVQSLKNLSHKYPNQNPIEGQYNYVFLYADYENPAHPGRGVKKEDHDAGTFHLQIGRDAGIVKRISFSKTDVKYLRESRMQNQGQAGLLQLSAVYNCTIDMIGNTLFLPGMEVWVDPYGFGGPKFGMPQDPPLRSMSDADEVDKFNEMVQDALDNDLLVQDGEYSIDSEAIHGKEEIVNTKTGKEISVEDFEKLGDGKQDEYDVRPRTGINSYANVMGIGGYQLITKVSCKITPGEYSTTVEGRHIYTGYPKAYNPQAMYEALNDKSIGSSKAPQEGPKIFCSKIAPILGDMDQTLTPETVQNTPTEE